MLRLRLAAVLASALGLTTAACGPPGGVGTVASAGTVDVTWADGGLGDVAPLDLLRVRIDLGSVVPAPDEVRLDLDGARVTAIPEACVASTVTELVSAIVDDDLVCRPATGTTSVVVDVIVDGRAGEQVDGTVTTRTGASTAPEAAGEVPPRTIAGRDARLEPDLRLLSSPDFLNGDVGDLADGPGSWADQPAATRTANSTNDAYERTLDALLDDWQRLDPAGVLVAGDLVDGRWGYDDTDSRNFGRVDTAGQQRRALRRAARTYYPQYLQRFADHDLTVFPAMGDHEYGDNPWPRRKRRLADDFKTEFARAFTTDRSGAPAFDDHPRGPARLTAYAGRPSPEVQVVTLDVFDITPARARIGVDPQQMRWLRDVLRRAHADGVEWIIVQAHTPVLYPVRARASSMLHYPGGSQSQLWKVFERFGVDLYLAGEVHDTTATESGGVVQVSHGGIFQFSLTTALVIDVYDDRLYLTLRDYDLHHTYDPDGRRLWETRRSGMPWDIALAGSRRRSAPRWSCRAAVVGPGCVESSGILVPTTDAD